MWRSAKCLSLETKPTGSHRQTDIAETATMMLLPAFQSNALLMGDVVVGEGIFPSVRESRFISGGSLYAHKEDF